MLNAIYIILIVQLLNALVFVRMNLRHNRQLEAAAELVNQITVLNKKYEDRLTTAVAVIESDKKQIKTLAYKMRR